MRHSHLSESRNTLLPLFYNDEVESTETGVHNATPNRFALSFSSPPWFVAGIPLTQLQVDTAMGQDTLLHGEALFVITTTHSDHVSLPFFIQSVSPNFRGHIAL